MKTTRNIPAPGTLAQTWIRRYELVALTGSFDGPTTGLTFYEAIKALKAARALELCGDATHVRRSGRCVAFFSDWHNAPRAMFGACDDERANVSDWTG